MSYSEATGSRVVRGHVVLAPDVPESVAGTMIVVVEDISRADAPSEVVGQQRQTGVTLEPGAAVPFTIEIPSGRIDERHSYSVRAHLDVSGTGEIDRGDFISVQTFPVLTRGRGSEARIEVRLV